jgi:CubicO group peptidase (beta-lactamase class C family)
MDSEPLLDLAKWVRDAPVHLYSLLISRHGKLVFELYTSSIERDAAHYLMSATKSVASALVGIAIDQHLLRDADESIAEALPESVFPSPKDRARFRSVRIKDLLSMSALDTPDPPRVNTPEALARSREVRAAHDRVRFVLGQPIVESPGTTFLYNDEGPILVTGILSYATHGTALDFAEKNLFQPMAFRNYEWMHQDDAGIDNGGYGLRLRPIDMQKFGLLYLRHGAWGGTQLVSQAWVDRSFQPSIRSRASAPAPDYGWFWWSTHYGAWRAHEANGWRGQRILVFPDQDVVVTMTGDMTDPEEKTMTVRPVSAYVIPSVEHGSSGRTEPLPEIKAEMARVLDEVHRAPSRAPAAAEPRMIPTVARKSVHHGAAF